MSEHLKTYLKKSSSPTEDSKEVTGSDVSGDKRALDVQVSGGSLVTTPSGLTKELKITTMDVTSMAPLALPAVALSDRNSMEITNNSTLDILYVGTSSVTADEVVGTTSGRKIYPGEGYAIDIKDTITLYGIAPAGKTIRVTVFEVA